MTARSGFDLIPIPARILAALLVPLMAGIFYWMFGGQFVGLPEIVALMVAGPFLVTYVLLAGYVYGDAARRGMPPVLWTALAVLIPNGVGFVLYFLLRKPILHACAGCGAGVGPDALFCPRCGSRQGIPAGQVA